jgi:hypothetical protein
MRRKWLKARIPKDMGEVAAAESAAMNSDPSKCGIPFVANIRENACASPKCPSRAAHVKHIREHGKKAWQKWARYNIWKAETGVSSTKKL